MKIATWNVNSLTARLPHLLRWLGEARPDVVGLQELKLEDAKFPVDAIAQAGYACVFMGQKTYNGVAILARQGLEMTDVQRGIPGFEDSQARAIAATVGGVRVVNLYVVNGQVVGSEKFDYKLRWLAAVQGWLASDIAQHPQMLVMGDFNIAPADIDVHDPKRWHEKILCSTPERAALGALQGLGLTDAYRHLHPEATKQFTWWDYRLMAYPRGWGLRIDLLLASNALLPRVVEAGIDTGPREWERPSDHAPAWVVVEQARA